MPLTAKGEKIKAAMEAEYGAEKGERVFYASKNAGKITGVDEMNSGHMGLKTYEDNGLVNLKEEPKAAATDAGPKAFDAKFTREFPHDPFGDTNPDDGGFKWEHVWSPEEMKNSPFAVFKE